MVVFSVIGSVKMVQAFQGENVTHHPERINIRVESICSYYTSHHIKVTQKGPNKILISSSFQVNRVTF